jgi:hypothetical protein
MANHEAFIGNDDEAAKYSHVLTPECC